MALLCYFILEFGWSMFFHSVPVHFRDLKYSHHAISLFITYSGLCMIIALISYKMVIKRLSLTATAKIGFVCSIVATLLMLFSDLKILQWFSITLIAYSVAVAYVSITALLSKKTITYQGSMMGILLTLMALSWTISASFTRLFYHYNAALPFIVATSTFILGFISLTLKKQTSYAALEESYSKY